MVKNKKRFVFRKKLAIYNRIRRNSTHHLVDNGFYSIKSSIQGSEAIPQTVKDDIMLLFGIIQKPFDEIIDLFEDQR